MKALRAIGVTGALLAAVWGGLLLVALASDALPGVPAPSVSSAETDAAVSSVDAGAAEPRRLAADGELSPPDPDSTAAAPPTAVPPESGPAPVPAEIASVAPTLVRRYHVCDLGTFENAGAEIAQELDTPFAVGDVLGDPAPEVVVGCGDRFVVVGLSIGAPSVAALRVAELAMESRRDIPVHTAQPAIGDVTGDGRPDLVLPFYQRATSGGSRGGRALVWRRREEGLARPTSFGSFTVQDVTLVDLDGRGGLDVLAVDRGRPWGDQPGAVHVHSGGSRPRQRASLTGGKWARSVVALDFDTDGTVDVVASSDEQLHLHRRREGYRFDEPLVVPSTRYWSMTTGDVNGDAHPDLIVGGADRLAVLLAGPDEERRLTPALQVGGRVDPVQVVDVDGDGRPELLSAGDALRVHSMVEPRWTTTVLATGGASLNRIRGARWIPERSLLIWSVFDQSARAIELFVAERPTQGPLPSAGRATALPDAPVLLRQTIH